VREAFPELVRSNSKLIYRVSLGILKNHADAEDNLQNVFIKAYSNIHRFEGRSRLSSWLVRIAINEALMKIRKRRAADTGAHTETAKDGDSETLKVEDNRPNPEHQCIVNDLAAKALGCLSPYLQDTFILSATEGWTAQELANVMGVSIVAIKTRIFRARTRMRYHLASLKENRQQIGS
jgi:RNA polymerase sigma-70 factor (ECF subfamily)